jgi:hypothetical protein
MPASVCIAPMAQEYPCRRNYIARARKPRLTFERASPADGLPHHSLEWIRSSSARDSKVGMAGPLRSKSLGDPLGPSLSCRSSKMTRHGRIDLLDIDSLVGKLHPPYGRRSNPRVGLCYATINARASLCIAGHAGLSDLLNRVTRLGHLPQAGIAGVRQISRDDRRAKPHTPKCIAEMNACAGIASGDLRNGLWLGYDLGCCHREFLHVRSGPVEPNRIWAMLRTLVVMAESLPVTFGVVYTGTVRRTRWCLAGLPGTLASFERAGTQVLPLESEPFLSIP